VAALVIVALIVLPAILRLLGPHIDRLSISFIAGRSTSQGGGAGARWSRTVRRWPVLFLILSLAALLALASPILSMRLGSADAGGNPESSTTRRAYDLLAQGFGAGFNGPILIAVEIDDANAKALVETLPEQLGQIEGVAFAPPPLFNEAGDAAILTVIPTSSPQDEITEELVIRLRQFMPEATGGSNARAFVGGQTAAFIDIARKISDGMPVFFVAVIGLSVLLLAVVFRSIIVPIKAALMILLSVGVGFGVVTALFQWGWLSGITGVDSTGPIESFLPMMLFAVLLGLSMDYEVFLVTRVQEEFLNTGDGSLAVERGQAVTFRVIIAAGLIMSSVFLSFALADARVIKEFGFGLGTAILADALLVRMVLVPSIMHLAGNNAWWFPAWVDKRLPSVSVDGDASALTTPAGASDD
jgi:RND superfamily putative drug exporter